MFRSVKKFVQLVSAFFAAVQLMASPVYAKDYTVDYDIETPSDRDAGSTACSLRTCYIKIERLNLTLIIRRDERRHAYVEIQGQPGCCFFELGARSKWIALDEDPPPDIRFFSGMAARGLLLFRNEPAGILSLRFHLD